MNRSKKLAITLAVLAALGGSSYIQPEQAFAAEYVIDGDMEFEALKSNDDWDITDKGNAINPNKSSFNNSVVFKNITQKMSLRAGYSTNSNVNNNTLVIINSNIDTSSVADAGSGGDHIAGGFASEGYNANKNKVILKDSIVKAYIYGGDSYGGDACGNIVVIDNTTIEGKYRIYGGYTYVTKDEINTAEGGEANDNTIIIKGDSHLEESRIYGGFVRVTKKDPADGNLTEEDFRKGNNSVIFDDWSGSVLAVRSADNVIFKNVNLSDFVNKTSDKAILTITGGGSDSSFSNIIGSDSDPIEDVNGNTTKDINIGLSFKGGADINAGDTVRLIQMTGGGATVDEKQGEKIKLANNGTAYAGVAQVIKGELVFDKLDDGDSTQNKYLDYTITSVGLNDQVNVVNEGRAASAAFLNQSDELISEALAGLNLEDKYGFETFAMVYGNDSRYGTNSDLSINGWSGLVGVGSNNKTKAGDFAWAAFFENGAGNYDISTTMNGITMEGDGSTVYNGGGIAARLTGENGVYGEASLRAGLLKNDLENGLLGADNNKYGYESESNYYGMHIGIGKIFKLENGASVDTYAKYYHSTVKDDSFTIDSDEFEMDDINSDRLRLGIRYNQGMDRTFNVYYGAAWEYEFNGESNGYAQGHKMEETSLKGSTVIGELGVVIQPENSPWSFDAKVKGYGGQRDGYSGSILATYHF